MKNQFIKKAAVVLAGIISISQLSLISTFAAESDSSGRGFTTAGQWFNTGTREKIWAVDVNGDGRTDLLGIKDDGNLSVSLSEVNSDGEYTGKYTNTQTVSTYAFPVSADWFDIQYNQRVWAADVTGDGKADLVGVAKDGRIFTALNTSKNNKLSFDSYSYKADPNNTSGTSFKTEYGWFDTDSRDRVWAVDIDGDGKADIVGISNDGDVYYAKSNGDGSFQAVKKIEANIFPASAGWFSTDSRQRVWPADITGNGCVDFVGISTDGRIYTAINNGKYKISASSYKGGDERGFTTSGGWFLNTSANRIWLCDVNGDGKMDVVGISDNGSVYQAISKGNGAFEPIKTTAADIFKSKHDWFSAQYKQRVWPADFNGNGYSDFIGVDFEGRICKGFVDPAFGKVITEGESHIGKPYLWGAAGPDKFDCSGFIYYVYNQSGIKSFSRRTARALFKDLCVEVSKANRKPGDLVFFSDDKDSNGKPVITHVGIYIGNDMMLHSGGTPGKVSYVKINTSYYTRTFYAYGRLK